MTILPPDCASSVTVLEYCSQGDMVTSPASVFVVLDAVYGIHQLVMDMHQACGREETREGT